MIPLKHDDAEKLTTNEVAQRLRLEPGTLRKRHGQTGSYFGLRPVKMNNGRLLWPADAVAKLVCNNEASND